MPGLRVNTRADSTHSMMARQLFIRKAADLLESSFDFSLDGQRQCGLRRFYLRRCIFGCIGNVDTAAWWQPTALSSWTEDIPPYRECPRRATGYADLAGIHLTLSKIQ